MTLVPLINAVAAILLIPAVFAAPSWNQIPVKEAYVPRPEAAFTQCGNGKLCLLGGRGVDPVSILDTKTLSWSSGKVPPMEIHHFQAFQGPDKCAWVVGAWTGPFPKEETVDKILIYCPDLDEWSSGPPINRPRGAGGAFLLDGSVYLVSGNVGGHNAGANLVDWFDKLDLETGTWSTLPPIPNPRDHFHAVVLNNKLYVAAGRDSTGKEPEFFDDVEEKVDIFDFDSQEWSTGEDFPRPRGGTFATAFGDTVFILGGEGENRAWVEVDVLDGSSFKPGEDMPTPRHGAGAVSCNGAIWVAGGTTVQGGGTEASDTIAYFDGDEVPTCGSSESNSPPPSPVSSKPTPTSEPSTAVASQNPPTPTEDGDSDALPSEQTPGSNAEEAQGSSTPSPGVSDNSEDPDDTEPVPSEEDSGPACFPSDAVVELRDGRMIKMDQLKIGDEVKVGATGEYSEVFFFSHRNGDRINEFIRIETESNSMTVSPGHLVYANGKVATASSVRVGDSVSASQDTVNSVAVVTVQRIKSKGLHNPHTFHGDIVVNGLVATTFTSAVHPSVARLLLIPFHLSYKIFGAHIFQDRLNAEVLRILQYGFWREYN